MWLTGIMVVTGEASALSIRYEEVENKGIDRLPRVVLGWALS